MLLPRKGVADKADTRAFGSARPSRPGIRTPQSRVSRELDGVTEPEKSVTCSTAKELVKKHTTIAARPGRQFRHRNRSAPAASGT
jgi:hypothetical protein